MKQNRKQNTKLKANSKGASLTEYGILVALIGVVGIASVGNLGDRVKTTFGSLTSTTQSVATGTVFSQGNDEGAGAVGDATEAPVETIDCFDPTSVGLVGNTGLCDGMLIVDNTMLRAAGSNHWMGPGGDGSFTIAPGDAYAPEGLADTFTFGDGEFNIFTGQVTDMSYLFMSSPFNGDIGYWNVSNVTNMDSMFRIASSFNQDIGDWDTSSVTNMATMFFGTSSFNQNIGSWDTSNVTTMNSMFRNTSAFNQNIDGWNVSSVNFFGAMYMFDSASAMTFPLGSWEFSFSSQPTNFSSDANATFRGFQDTANFPLLADGVTRVDI